MNEQLVRRSTWLGYAVTLILEVLLTAVLLLLSPRFPMGNFPITYVLLTMIVAYFFGSGPAVVAGIVGWLAFTTLFVPPTGLTWPIADSSEGWARQAAFFLGVTIVAIAALQAKKANRRIQSMADESAALNVALRDEVAERRRTEEAQAEVEAQLRTVLENITEGVIVANPEGELIHWNRIALQMHGYASIEEARRPMQELARSFEACELDGTILSAEDWPIWRVLRGEQVRDRELYVRRADQGWERIWTFGGSTVYDVDGKPLLALLTMADITERKQAEEQIRQFNTELERRVNERTAELQASNKELETLSYSIMHDLRTPLRAVGGFSDALLKHYTESVDERGADYLRRIAAAAEKMGRIIDDIHNLLRAARTPVRVQEVDMSAMAGEILSGFVRSEPLRNVEITVKPGLTVHADAGLLRVAVYHLLQNAWKFTGGREAARIEVGSTISDGDTVFLVRDNGVGFNPAYADKLFVPFQRLHSESEFPGTGIGLALVERILRRHGGRIWAESEVDKGATFYFTLGHFDE